MARAIHGESDRSGKPFVAVNCRTLPEHLVETVLFGSFASDSRRQTGRFFEADQGTLFLDEIGELSSEAQIKLNRALQDGAIGVKYPVKVDVRVIASTNRNLITLVQEGRFREDLYYRLNVLPIWVPPLRDRLDDVPELVRHFIARFAAEEGKRVEGIEPTSLATDFLPAAVEALAALKRGYATGNREVYLFSDMQRSGWDVQAAALKGKYDELRRAANVYLVRCGTRAPGNATLAGILPPPGIPHTGGRASFTVLVRNSGAKPLDNLTVTLEVDGRAQEREARKLDDLNPGETRPVPLTAKLDRAGLVPLTATVGPDELDGDNRYDLVLDVRDQVRVLVVDGQPNEVEPEKAGSYYLRHSLLSVVAESQRAGHHLQPRLVGSRQAAAAPAAGGKS